MNNLVIVIMFVAVFLLGIGILVMISLSRKYKPGLNVEKYRTEWFAIQKLLENKNSNAYAMAILNADKMLDGILKDSGVSGETMGERLKSSKGKLNNLNGIWTAHKLRNRIAHESDVKITFPVVKKTLLIYKKAFKELGVL